MSRKSSQNIRELSESLNLNTLLASGGRGGNPQIRGGTPQQRGNNKPVVSTSVPTSPQRLSPTAPVPNNNNANVPPIKPPRNYSSAPGNLSPKPQQRVSPPQQNQAQPKGRGNSIYQRGNLQHTRNSAQNNNNNNLQPSLPPQNNNNNNASSAPIVLTPNSQYRVLVKSLDKIEKEFLLLLQTSEHFDKAKDRPVYQTRMGVALDIFSEKFKICFDNEAWSSLCNSQIGDEDRKKQEIEVKSFLAQLSGFQENIATFIIANRQSKYSHGDIKDVSALWNNLRNYLAAQAPTFQSYKILPHTGPTLTPLRLGDLRLYVGNPVIGAEPSAFKLPEIWRAPTSEEISAIQAQSYPTQLAYFQTTLVENLHAALKKSSSELNRLYSDVNGKQTNTFLTLIAALMREISILKEALRVVCKATERRGVVITPALAIIEAAGKLPRRVFNKGQQDSTSQFVEKNAVPYLHSDQLTYAAAIIEHAQAIIDACKNNDIPAHSHDLVVRLDQIKRYAERHQADVSADQKNDKRAQQETEAITAILDNANKILNGERVIDFVETRSNDFTLILIDAIFARARQLEIKKEGPLSGKYGDDENVEHLEIIPYEDISRFLGRIVNYFCDLCAKAVEANEFAKKEDHNNKEQRQKEFLSLLNTFQEPLQYIIEYQVELNDPQFIKLIGVDSDFFTPSEKNIAAAMVLYKSEISKKKDSDLDPAVALKRSTVSNKDTVTWDNKLKNLWNEAIAAEKKADLSWALQNTYNRVQKSSPEDNNFLTFTASVLVEIDALSKSAKYDPELATTLQCLVIQAIFLRGMKKAEEAEVAEEETNQAEVADQARLRGPGNSGVFGGVQVLPTMPQPRFQ